MSTCSLLRSEGHGDTVLVTGHEVGVTEVSARVLSALVFGAVVAVPVTWLTKSYERRNKNVKKYLLFN